MRRAPFINLASIWLAATTLAGISAGMSNTALAQTARGEGAAAPRRAAEAALPTLRKAATGAGARLLGFRSDDEAARATLGEPLPIRIVRLDALRAYGAATDPASLLVDTKRILFPVVSGAEVRTGIEVREKRGVWGAGAIGGAQLAVLLDAARAEHRKSAGAGASYFAVQVPALNLYLLEADTAGGRMLVPLADDPRFPDLHAGKPVSLADAWAALAPAAKALDPRGSS
jgi:hypothetical protein